MSRTYLNIANAQEQQNDEYEQIAKTYGKAADHAHKAENRKLQVYLTEITFLAHL